MTVYYLCRERERDLLRLDLDLDLERECLRLLSFLPGKKITTSISALYQTRRETTQLCVLGTMYSLPGSIAAEMSDCASRTLFMASSISLLEASDFRPMLAAIGFILQDDRFLSQTRFGIRVYTDT